MAYSECLPTRLSPPAERACFFQVTHSSGARIYAMEVDGYGNFFFVRPTNPTAGPSSGKRYIHLFLRKTLYSLFRSAPNHPDSRTAPIPPAGPPSYRVP
jgi:hypothetical protein